MAAGLELPDRCAGREMKADPAGPLRSSVWPAGPANLSPGRNGENLRPAGQDFNAAAIRSTAAKSPSRRVT